MIWNYFVAVLIILFSCASSQNTTSDDDCTCVKYYLCDLKTRTVISDGNGTLTERFGIPKKCGYREVCCNFADQIDTTVKKCGQRNPDGVDFKISGDATNVAFGEFPWMVGILNTNGGYRCGGSLIHPSIVLTAAHCVLQNTTFIARAGEWDSSTTTEVFKQQDRTTQSVKYHENYRPGVYYNDVALLFLSSPFDLLPHVNVACLPPASTVVDHARCYATGWGKDRYGAEGKYPAILKAVELPMVPRSTCQENLRKTRVGRYFYLHQSFVCAGGEKGVDTCIGDGGGPLVCPIDGEDGRYQQIGIVSWGIGCSDENVPGVYTNVAYLRDWIDKQVKDKGFDTKSYQY